MNLLICAGGSGTRVLEGVLHLCAAGLGPDELSVLVIDPDGGNGNGERTKILLNKYIECQKAFGGNVGKKLAFFHTRLDLPGSRGVLKAWSPVGVNQEFSDILNYNTLDRANRDVAHLLFTDQELDMETDVGFRGHPAIGAAAMALLSLYKDQAPWSQLAQKIRQDVTQDGVRVAIVGSVFGGTGASSLHPLARFLRSLPETNHERLKLAAVALVPYFQFRSGASGGASAGTAAKSEWFALATKSAAEFYQYLRENEKNSPPFDSFYWVGDDSLMEVDYQIGGPRQENPAHFVDLLAAIACLDFMSGAATANACCYAGPQECDEALFENKNVLRWEDIPLSVLKRETIKTRLLQFMLVGAMHLGFFEPLFKEPRVTRRPYLVPWYLDRFVSDGDYLTAPGNWKSVELVTEFFGKLSMPWWQQIHATEQDRIRLFNRNAFVPDAKGGGVSVDMFCLGNLLWPDRISEHTKNMVDRFFSDMVDVAATTDAARGAPTYLALLGNAAGRFVEREYEREKREVA